MKKTLTILIIYLLVVNIVPTNIINASSLDRDYIDVKIGSQINNSKKTILFSQGGFRFYDRLDKEEVLYQTENSNIEIERINNIINILDMEGNILTQASGDGSIILGPNSYGSLEVDGNIYRGFLTFLVSDNNIDLVNHINIDDYLYGVLPREMGHSYPTEALKAQAIASRSFTRVNINKHMRQGYNLCNTEHCQVYGGASSEKEKTNAAVDETKGLYAVYNGEVIEAIYHSTSGGYTEDSSKVWGGEKDYLVAVEDKFSENTTSSNWSLNLSPSEINKKLIADGINIGELYDIDILQVSKANRVLEIKLTGSKGEEIIEGTKFRNILGARVLKSTWFTIGKENDHRQSSLYAIAHNNEVPVTIDFNKAVLKSANKTTLSKSGTTKILGGGKLSSFNNSHGASQGYTFSGNGYGHGVGMSQQGAGEMGKLGYNYEDILKHYYTGIEIIYIGE